MVVDIDATAEEDQEDEAYIEGVRMMYQW